MEYHTSYFRELDTRIARWWSTDPVTFPHQSPYNIFDANPVYWTDPSGASVGKVGDGDDDDLVDESGGGAAGPSSAPSVSDISIAAFRSYIGQISNASKDPRGVIFVFDHSQLDELNNTLNPNDNWDIVAISGLNDPKIKSYFENHKKPNAVAFYGHGWIGMDDSEDKMIGGIQVNGNVLDDLSLQNTDAYNKFLNSEQYKNNEEHYKSQPPSALEKKADKEKEMWEDYQYIVNQIAPGGTFISIHCSAGADRDFVEACFNSRTVDNSVDMYFGAGVVLLSRNVIPKDKGFKLPRGWSNGDTFFDFSVLDEVNNGFTYISSSQPFTQLRDNQGYILSLKLNTKGNLFSITYPSKKLTIKNFGSSNQSASETLIKMK